MSTIKKDGLANFFRTIIEILPFNTSFNNLINAFPVAIFSFLVLGYILSFNFLSMAYIILTLTVWYFYLCIARNLPKYKSNIKLSDDHGHFSDVYIIDEHSKDYITIIGKDNNIKKIMKSAVISIERQKNDNNSGIVKEIITLQRPNKA